MRFYAMGNYYLSSIQQGIQAAHAMGEMFVNYGIKGVEHQCLHEWAEDHKTMVLLNGGNSHDLRELWLLLSDPRNTEFPVAKFNEDYVSLDGALTCVAIVLPERLYDAEWVLPDEEFPAWVPATGRWFYDNKMITGWEAELLDVIKKLPLAR